MKVNIKERKIVHDGFLKVETVSLRYEKFDGKMSEWVVRENCLRCDSAAALVYDINIKRMVFVKQFRYPVYAVSPEDAWMLEIPAGAIDEREDPKDAMMRELQEEIHLNVRKEDVVFIGKYFSSPGGSSERIFLYSVECDLAEYGYQYGGSLAEHEDIQIVVLPFQQVYEALTEEKIVDGKTIMALLWLEKQLSKYYFGI